MTTHSTSSLALVDITSVHNDAMRVRFSDVRKGDWVFDAWGERHKVAQARVIKHGVLSLKREDYPREYIYPENGSANREGTIVIVPEHGWTQSGHGYRDVPGQPEGPGFKFGEFYETCRCGLVIGSGADGDASTASMLLEEHADEANGREFYRG